MSVFVAFATGRARRRLGRTGASIALCLLFSSFCSVADAQSWQCRAPEGSFANHEIEVSEATTQFSGEMVIHRANGLSRWHPTAKVVFTDRDLAAAGCACNGVVATWYPENPETFLVSLSVDGKQVPLGLVPYDKPVTFTLDFARDGALKLEVGTGVATGRSAVPKRNTLRMSCSTADVAFKVAVVPVVEARSPERCPFAAQEQWTRAEVDRYCKVRG